MSFSLVHTLHDDGMMTAILFNKSGKRVAYLAKHMKTGEEIIVLARKFEEENPDLFNEEILIDTADETEKKNPELFEKNRLSTIPGN